MIDLTRLSTEQSNSRTISIDEASAMEIVRLINKEDQTVPQTIQKILPDIARAITVIAGHLSHGGRLFYIGSGTSGRLGILDAAECPPTYSTPPNLIQGIIAGGAPAIFKAQEGAEDSPEAGENDLKDKELTNLDVVVGLTASGCTPYVLGALDYARSVKAYTMAITCSQGSEVSSVADLSLAAITGPEVIAGSTRMKAGTAQKLILNMLSTGSMILLGKVYKNLMVDLQCTNAKLKIRARNIVSEATGCDTATADFFLKQGKGNAKTAILMYLADLDYETAQTKLKENGNFLKKTLLSLNCKR